MVSWVVATEKVRAWKAAGVENQMKSEMGSEWENPLLAANFDFSQIDPWLKKVPCPWRFDSPTRMALRWSSWGIESFKLPTALSKSDSDDLVLLENFIDIRTFFEIDVLDSAEWAKTARENVERLMRRSTSPAEQLVLSIWWEQLATFFPYKK